QDVPDAKSWVWIALFGVVTPLYVVWLLRSVYDAALLALQVLGPPGRRALHLQLDDMLSLTPLSSEEMVAGGIAAILPPLIPVTVTGAVLIWATYLRMSTEFGSTALGTRPESYWLLLGAPLTAAA